MRTRRKAKRGRRTFTLQMYDNILRTAAEEFECEAKLLNGLTRSIEACLGFPTECSSIRHDEDAFHCYIGTCDQDRTLIVKKRSKSVLLWTGDEARAWCMEVVEGWLKANGLPPLGNHLARPLDTSEQEATSTLSTGTDDG